MRGDLVWHGVLPHAAFDQNDGALQSRIGRVAKIGRLGPVEFIDRCAVAQGKLMYHLGGPVGAAMGADQIRHQAQDRDAARHRDATAIDDEVVARGDAQGREGRLEILAMEGMDADFASRQQTFLGKDKDAGANPDNRDSSRSGRAQIVAMARRH